MGHDRVDGAGEGDVVRQQRRDVLEDDAGLREVWYVDDTRAQQSVEVDGTAHPRRH
jgi:hypothetical protein